MISLPSSISSPAPSELGRDVGMFENTWSLATILATALAVLCWYFGVAQVNIGPIIWILASLAVAQLGIGALMSRAESSAAVQRLTLVSQLLGTLMMGVTWHCFGGVQQPLFPLFIVLPLIPAARFMNFWQTQVSTLALVAVLVSGLLLAPDTNSFIEERYGLRVAASALFPEWLPRSAVAFPDVSTSPSYDLMLIVTLAVIGFAVSTTARALVELGRRNADRLGAVEGELARTQHANKDLVAHAPSCEVLVSSLSGRIVNASERFARAFDAQDAAGKFLLDVVAFTYPAVIRQLMTSGGDEVQEATVRGREVLLRVRAETLGSGTSQTVTLNIESAEDLCLQGALDALDEPVLAIGPRDRILFMNHAASSIFGTDSQGASATELFGAAVARWWDIAPLESARRILDRGEKSYLVSTRRMRVAPSVGEIWYVHLRLREAAA